MPLTQPRSGAASLAADVLAEASGRSHRQDPNLPDTGGPAGNAKLTAWTGLLLLVLFVAEGVTLLDVHGLISWHIVIGTLLIPPSLLKTGSTGWRIIRYYRHSPAYQLAGPPPMLLRVMGPAVVASTLGVLASGVLLILLGPRSSRTHLVSPLGFGVDAVTIHKALFFVWAAFTGAHVLARLLPALGLTVRRGRSVAGGSRRMAAIVVSIALAAALAGVVLAWSGSWQGDAFRHQRPPGVNAPAAP